MFLEFPSGPVPLDSPFYITRSPEELTYQEINKPGSVVRITAPRKMGKSSLMLRICHYAREQGYRTALINFQQADESIFKDLNSFLRWFCANLSLKLNLTPQLDEFWDEDIGSKISCTLYLQGYILSASAQPLVFVLNEVNRVFEYPHIAKEFLPLLRSWHEEAKQAETFQQLRLVAINSTEVYISLNINQSPFNVGLPVRLSEFNRAQLLDLARRHQLDWTQNDRADRLMEIVGGHPYLIRLALYYFCTERIDFDRLLEEAPTLAGIYSNHLQGLLAALRHAPELSSAFQQTLTSDLGVQLDTTTAYKLQSLGLVKFDGDRVKPSCELYRRYFSNQKLEDGVSQKIEQLQQTNRELQEMLDIDSLTQIFNRRRFDIYLNAEWKRLLQSQNPLSLILCDIDRFKAYNDTYGHLAGDFCLQQVARALRACATRNSDLVARYGGEEFAIVLPDTDAIGAERVARKIQETVKALQIVHEGIQQDDRSSTVTLSFGVASTIPQANDKPEILIRAADEALYESKHLGRDRVTLSSSFNFGVTANE